MSLIKGDGNNLYGVLRNKGTANIGYIYRIDTAIDNLQYVADLSSVGWVIDEPFGDIIYNSDLNKIYGTKDKFDGGSNWGGGVYSFDIATGTASNLFTISYSMLAILGNNATGIVQGNNGKMYALCKNGGANDNGTIIEYNLSGNSYIKVFDFPNGPHPKGTGLHVRGSQIYGAFETNNNGYALWSFDYILGDFKQIIPTSLSLPGYNMDFQTCIDNGKIIGRMKNGGIANAGSFFSHNLLTDQTSVLAENHSQEGRSLLGELTQLNDSILLGFTGMGGELEIPSSTKLHETGNLVQINTKTGAISVLSNAWYGAFAEHEHKFKANRPLVGSNNKLYYSYFNYGYYGGYHLAEYDLTSHTRVDYLGMGADANIWETVGSIEISKGKIVTANQDSLYVYDFNSNTFSERKFTHDKDQYGTFHGNIKQASNGRIYGLTRAKPGKPYLDHKAVIYSMDTVNFTFKVEHTFDAIVRNCNAGLTELSGKLWGSTNYGGTNDHGYLFSYEISTGTFTVEHNFDRTNDGAGFEAEWTPLSGKLYSTSYTGGQQAYGTLVEFDPANTSNPFRVVKQLSMQNGRAFRASPMTYISKRIALNNNIEFVNPVLIGQSDDASLTISNTGNSTLTVSGIDVPSGFSVDWTSGTIASGGSQAVLITFSPTDDIDYSGTITVNGDQTSGTNSVSVSGTALLTSMPHEVQQYYTVYPNPAKSMITIKGVDGLKRVELIDLLGRLIVFKELNNNIGYYELNLSDQNLKGMFLLNIYSVRGKISSRKIVFE